MAEVESFKLDHTKVRAPYVRLAGQVRTPRGDVVEKYDLRLAQPNQEALPTAALHTLEHLLAGLIRDELPGVIDLSPMGCRTGFYLTVLGPLSPERILEAFRKALEGVLLAQEIPGASERECGNHLDHDLEGAKAWAQRVLEAGLKVQESIYL